MSVAYQSLKSVPTGSFIHRYMRALRHSETPHVYDFWSAMWMLSSLVPRRVIVPRPYAPVRLNLYVMFISDSGATRKSTSISFAFDSLKKVAPNIEYVDAREGPEHLEHRLIEQKDSEESRVVICVSELMRFLGKQAYNSAMPGLLTDLYDCPERRSSGFLSSGKLTYNNVYVTLLAGSTPAWLMRAVNPSVVEGGFTSRVFIIATNRRKQLNPWYDGPMPPMRPALHALVEAAKGAADIGQIRMTPNAIKHYKTWYKRMQGDVGNDAYTASFASRQQDHVLRVAGLLAVNSKEYQITEYTLRAAIRIVDDVRAMGLTVFGGGHPESRITKAVNKMASILIKNGTVGIMRSDLRNKMRPIVSLQEFNDIIDLCIEAGVIYAAQVPQATGQGRPATYYFAGKKLKDERVRDDVIENLTS